MRGAGGVDRGANPTTPYPPRPTLHAPRFHANYFSYFLSRSFWLPNTGRNIAFRPSFLVPEVVHRHDHPIRPLNTAGIADIAIASIIPQDIFRTPASTMVRG